MTTLLNEIEKMNLKRVAYVGGTHTVRNLAGKLNYITQILDMKLIQMV